MILRENISIIATKMETSGQSWSIRVRSCFSLILKRRSKLYIRDLRKAVALPHALQTLRHVMRKVAPTDALVKR